jgi:hypothetical protein
MTIMDNIRNNPDETHLITQEMLDWVGSRSLPLTSPDISESDIRRAAIAMYWPEVPPRIYWDSNYAIETVWKGIVAPAEMNPFSWIVGRAHIGPQPNRINSDQNTIEESRQLRPPGAPKNYLFGGLKSSYYSLMRPGDKITSIITSTDVYEKKGSTGQMLFYLTNEIWTNQNNKTIKETVTTNIQWE